MTISSTAIRRASPEDALKIIQLYYETYGGTYPDLMMSDYATLKRVLETGREEYCWMVAEASTPSQVGSIVGSVVYRIDVNNRLAKVYGAAVATAFRGCNLTEQLMTKGFEILRQGKTAVEIVYATTRTVAAAPQKLTANLGYRKLGIFPNVHKTEEYETHCLTAFFDPQVFSRRFTDFRLHPKIAPLFEVVRQECELPPLANADIHALENRTDSKPWELEVIHAPLFVRHRFQDEKPMVQEHHWFFPFQEPNVLLTTPDQSIEVFAYYSEIDQHCVLIGIRDVNQVGYGPIFRSACKVLRRMGARYIEFIMRADETRKIEIALESEFIPCAYFPAMQLSAAGYRFDYVIFSRSFEILDFRDLKLDGVNRRFLAQYFSMWKESSLDPILQPGA